MEIFKSSPSVLQRNAAFGLSIAFFNSSNAEKFSLGGFLPALWLVSDLGGSSQLVEGGLLMMGDAGLLFDSAMWRGRPKSLSESFPNLQPMNRLPKELRNRTKETLFRANLWLIFSEIKPCSISNLPVQIGFLTELRHPPISASPLKLGHSFE